MSAQARGQETTYGRSVIPIRRVRSRDSDSRVGCKRRCSNGCACARTDPFCVLVRATPGAVQHKAHVSSASSVQVGILPRSSVASTMPIMHRSPDRRFLKKRERVGWSAVSTEESDARGSDERDSGSDEDIPAADAELGETQSVSGESDGRPSLWQRVFKGAKEYSARTVSAYICGELAFASFRTIQCSGEGTVEEKTLPRRQSTVGDWRRQRRGNENAVCNQKHSAWTFVPKTLYIQFSMFYNSFYLAIAIAQLVPAIRVGFVWTYFGPLTFVIGMSMAKEASDEILRYRRDREVNNYEYTMLVLEENARNDTQAKALLSSEGVRVAREVQVPSRNIRVGDILRIDCDQRVPADCVLLRVKSNDSSQDSLFIRTDQLDGETDWKVRRAVGTTQRMACDADVLISNGTVYAQKPNKEIYNFIGTYSGADNEVEPLNLENTLWANTVIASGSALCLVIYCDGETRSSLNTSQPRSKIGKLDLEVNFLSKMLFLLLVGFSVTLTLLRGLYSNWWLYLVRYFLLLAYIIPLAMRVNIDMARVLYSRMMQNDHGKMPGCVVRSSNLPEELGRLQFVLTDKTGTLTQNDMEFKKLHVEGTMYSRESLHMVRDAASQAFSAEWTSKRADGRLRGRGKALARLREALIAIAIAHNVTPAEEHGERTMQASSPDEIALVKFVESVGVVLLERSRDLVRLRLPGGYELAYDVLMEFPFSSEAKRMGAVVRDKSSGRISFVLKGADSVIARIVNENDWLEEECDNLALDGLRTLAYSRRELSPADFDQFRERWRAASSARIDRKERMMHAQESIEHGMDIIALTGVEDKLQGNVREALEKLRNAGLRVWMLTGDKVETAKCIATSAQLVGRSQRFFTLTNVKGAQEAEAALSSLRRGSMDDVLVVDGVSLQTLLDHFEDELVDLAFRVPAAVACRCSPTQKAAVAEVLQRRSRARVAAIGDGGNDVAMIEQADVGVGIPGKEGQQASLAADFSVTSFAHLTRLLTWHGRNSYKRTARLAQFIMHRGLIIAVIQIVYCAMFYYAAINVYNSWIQVGYATVFTMLPVFSLVLDEDVTEEIADTYPELYKELQKGRALNLNSFLKWVWKSIYQGTTIMAVSVYILWDDTYFTTLNLSAVSFTALILTELLMVAFDVHRWHWAMVAAELSSMTAYGLAIVFLSDVFDRSVIFSWEFLLRVSLVTLVSCLPVTLGKFIQRRFMPASYAKVA